MAIGVTGLTGIGAVLFNAMILIFFGILTLLNKLVVIPLTDLIKKIFPTFDTSIVNQLLNDYFIPGVRFAREVIVNTTGINRALLISVVFIFMAKLLFTFNSYIIKAVLNLWSLYRTGTAHYTNDKR